MKIRRHLRPQRSPDIELLEKRSHSFDIINHVVTWIKKLTSELLRRRVLRTLGAYIAIIWLLAQGLVDLFPAIGLPEWSIRVFLGAAVGALPLVFILAWKYDLTRKGILRDRHDMGIGEVGPVGNVSGPTQRSSMTDGGQRSMLHVAWKDEAGRAQEREFLQPFIVGRDFVADVRLNDDCVSRRHVEVYPVGADWYVKDLASLNGTFSNGQTIDVMRVDGTMEIRLDKSGPRIAFTKRTNDDTAFTVESGEATSSQ